MAMFYELAPDGDILLLLYKEPQEAKGSGEAGSNAHTSRPDTEIKRENPDEAAQSTERPVRMRVSSSHLVLASVRFKEMVSDNRRKEPGLRDGQPLEIKITNWEPISSLILMNIIHGRTSDIPRQVTLDVLCDIALLVDHYECQEVVGIMSEMWIKQESTALPKCFLDKVVTWIWIAYVFHQEDVFKHMTQLAIQSSTVKIDAHGLPIPERIISKSTKSSFPMDASLF
ncbi:hypothetical protein PRK78_001172 [Emydomyces testavorans]|uniref:BTB domain-containing protein n=1 Tax=Emydomyces testavorans TaxID=2070801 RepID=A0AAF0IIE5_9EURO|nr:hypothetical protein PRK78_001172 [Emydomyces testavorans]